MRILQKPDGVSGVYNRTKMVEANGSDAAPLLNFALLEVNGKAEGVKKIRQFVVSCNFYRRHLKNFTCSSAPLTDLIKTRPSGNGQRRSKQRWRK